VKEYKKKPLWAEYLKEAKRLKVPINSFLAQKKQAIKKLDNKRRFLSMPKKPAGMPQKPKQAYGLFMAAKKGSMELSEIATAWEQLEAEEKQKYTDQAEELQKQYEASLADFKASDEGKMYFKEVKSTVQRKRVNLAKVKYLGKLPKKPIDPKIKWITSNMPAAKKEFPDLSVSELKKKLAERLRALPQEEKDKLEEEGKAADEAYRQAMREFKESDDWKKYAKTVKPKGKGTLYDERTLVTFEVFMSLAGTIWTKPTL